MENPESPSNRRNVWRVSATWVLDLEQYNEWMTEEDYEVDENGKKKVHPARLSVEDIMQPPDEKKKSKTKRRKSPSPPPKAAKRKRF